MSDYILKIGGSVLTDKASRESISPDFREVLSKVQSGGILVHGAGSYGHPHAETHGLADGSRTGVLETHSAVKELNSKVVRQLRDMGIKAFPVHPSSMATRRKSTDINLEPVSQMVKEGFTPVIHGDGVVHSGEGFSVISGDEIAASAMNQVGAEKLGFCTSVPGVLDEEGEVIDIIEGMERFPEKKVEGKDVTGGMRNKLEKIFEKEVDARIFGEEELEGFLSGEEVGTSVRGSPR